jgi:hypothetical protein
MTTKFNMTESEFLAAAAPLALAIDDTSIVALPRRFSTGSLGWYASGKSPTAEKVAVLGVEFKPEAKAFSTGSTGSRIGGKVETTIAGVPVTLQVSGNLVKMGSKPGSTTKATGYQVGVNLVVCGSKPDAANAKAATAAAESFAAPKEPA